MTESPWTVTRRREKVGEQYKTVLPFTSGSFVSLKVSHADDRHINIRASVLEHKQLLNRIQTSNLRRFLGH